MNSQQPGRWCTIQVQVIHQTVLLVWGVSQVKKKEEAEVQDPVLPLQVRLVFFL